MSPVVRQQLPPTACAPLPDVAHAVLAEAEDDVPAAVVQGLAHHAIGLDEGLAVGVRGNVAVGAPVVLEIVDAPLGIGVGVLLLVLPTGREAGAGLGPGDE